MLSLSEPERALQDMTNRKGQTLFITQKAAMFVSASQPSIFTICMALFQNILTLQCAKKRVSYDGKPTKKIPTQKCPIFFSFSKRNDFKLKKKSLNALVLNQP